MSRNVLIVDDQEDILLVLEREFRRHSGLSVASTTDPDEALRLVAEKNFNLVIVDVRLGSASGFDLVRAIQQTRPGTGTILMSAYRSASNRQMATDLGVVLFLEKPFQISRLINEVETYFERLENFGAEAANGAGHAPAITESTGLIHFKPQDLVQLFCLNGRSVVITLTNAEQIGEIYIQRGRVVHASFNGATGDDAFHALLQLPEPQLTVRDHADQVLATVKTSWEHLLLQAAVRSDSVG